MLEEEVEEMMWGLWVAEVGMGMEMVAGCWGYLEAEEEVRR